MAKKLAIVDGAFVLNVGEKFKHVEPPVSHRNSIVTETHVVKACKTSKGERFAQFEVTESDYPGNIQAIGYTYWKLFEDGKYLVEDANTLKHTETGVVLERMR